MLEDAHGNAIMPVLITGRTASAAPSPKDREKRRVDPYLAFDGGSGSGEHRDGTPPATQTKRGRKRKADLAREAENALALAQRHAREKENKYDLYLEAMVLCNGDRVQALSRVYRIEPEEVSRRFRELLADVQRGRSSSSISELLDANDAGAQARAKILAGHLYSPSPAVSLKAADMLAELDQAPKTTNASYETYARAILSES
jgi:hypothetical protein